MANPKFRGYTKKVIPPRKKKFTRNKTEQRYEDEVILPLVRAGKVLAYYYESWQFRLAERTTYLPDFVLIFEDRIEIHEVKGYWMQAGRVKWKACADKYPWFVWKAAMYKNKRWAIETYEGKEFDGDE